MDCKCTMSQRLSGDGCDVCNTTEAIDMLPTPEEFVEELHYYGFTQEQAEAISADVYQPLVNFIKILSSKIDGIKP